MAKIEIWIILTYRGQEKHFFCIKHFKSRVLVQKAKALLSISLVYERVYIYIHSRAFVNLDLSVNLLLATRQN